MNICHCASRKRSQDASIARFPTGRCSTCSCSTCAAIADPMGKAWRRAMGRPPISSALRKSPGQATWKVIAADMPIGLIVVYDTDRKWGVEAIAQGDGPPRGRELEIVDILSFIKRAPVRNTLWLTADVHYTAAHYYDPNKAVFQDFEPF